MTNTDHKTYGMLAEFEHPENLIQAVKAARNKGFVKMDAYTPFPIHGLDEALKIKKTILPLLVLMAGIGGCLIGYLMQVYISVFASPYNIGGRPLHSWPAFIPVSFEITILVAGLTAAFGMLLLNGLPKPHNPLFNSKEFQLASRDRFFLCIEAKDPQFHVEDTKKFLKGLNPLRVVEVDE